MAWSWSHTPEAYENAKRNMENLEISELQVIYVEWEKWDIETSSGLFGEKEYSVTLEKAKGMTDEQLTEFIWTAMEEYCTCDNGGYNAYCCPYGCHTVPFSNDDD